jgi:hypothetical protein
VWGLSDRVVGNKYGTFRSKGRSAIMNLAVSIVGISISIISAVVSFWASRRAARLSSEQEQLRRLVRSNAIYGLIATYELIDDLGTYLGAIAEKKRVDKEFITSFLSARVDDLSKIHGSAAYYLWKRTAASFMLDRSITEEPMDQILGRELYQSISGKRMLENHPKGIGMALVDLETNHWISSIDALYRLRLGNGGQSGSAAQVDLSAEMQAQNALIERYGADGAEVIKILLHYLDSTSILVRLLRYYESDLSRSLDTKGNVSM